MDFGGLNYSFGNLNFGFGGQTPAEKIQEGITPQQEIFDDDDYTPAGKIVDGTSKDKTQTRKRNRARTMELTVLPERFEYRRAFSEVKMLEAMRYVKLENGVLYNFITAGDVDSLSYLKVVLNQHSLDYLLVSTWCMNAGDILQIQEWWEAGKFKKFDMHLGEIFPGSYKIEWQMIKKFYAEHPEVGRATVFKNHSKIYAGANYEEAFYFGIQTSANINTNPRTEQGNITIDKGLFEFYKEYFDGINSFEKD